MKRIGYRNAFINHNSVYMRSDEIKWLAWENTKDFQGIIKRDNVIISIGFSILPIFFDFSSIYTKCQCSPWFWNYTFFIVVVLWY